jgi:hypothetical protein
VSSAERGTSIAAEIEAQKRSNRSSVVHAEPFAGHRERSTILALRAAPRADARLCVLGAGNCLDLELGALAERYREIHLVDIDEEALRAAFEREPSAVRAKLVLHAPVDIAGFTTRLDRWANGSVTPDELMNLPRAVPEELARDLPAPFDVVLSSCVLTQLQLTLLHVLTDRHPLFEPLRELVGLSHLRLLASLVAGGGRAILTTDIASTVDGSLDAETILLGAHDALRKTLDAGRAIDVADPRHLAWLAKVDPMLAQTVHASEPVDAWFWHNGPDRIFMVYAIELVHKDARG